MTESSAGRSAATVYEAALALFPSGRFVVDPDIRAAWPGARVAGRAFTVLGAGGDNLALHLAVRKAPAGAVLVADVGGARFGHWGEVLTVAAQQRRIAGLVIDGGIRDKDQLQARGFPAFSRNDTVRTTRKKIRGALSVPVEIGGVTIETGDLVVADSDGVVAIPRDAVTGVLAQADERDRTEAGFLAALRDGASTVDLYGLSADPEDR